MNQSVFKILFGSQHERDIKRLLPALQQINGLEKWARSITTEEYPRRTNELKERHRGGESLDALLPEAFALVREAARRTLGERPFGSQVLGGIVLHEGKVMEMKTGEGKTLSCVSAALFDINNLHSLKLTHIWQ